jgi:hypothetical protein
MPDDFGEEMQSMSHTIIPAGGAQLPAVATVLSEEARALARVSIG